MNKKKKIINTEQFIKPKACITCQKEKQCTHILPFPDNLCEHCTEYQPIN